MGAQGSQAAPERRVQREPRGCLACLGRQLTQERRETQVQQAPPARMGARVRWALEAKEETRGPLEAWAKQVQQAAQARQVNRDHLAKQEPQAIRGRLEPRALREVLAQQVLREIQGE